MSVDMFLKIVGVNGESVDQSHAQEIDISSWSWGMSQSGTTHTAHGGGAGKVSVNDITITKLADKATPTLMKACCTGRHFDEAVITVRKAGDTPLEYVKLVMNDVIISNISVSGATGGDLVSEVLTLNFARFRYAYVPQSRTGGAEGVVEAGFDIAANCVA
ncbi:MAG TPA: type VI secretion system tube protein Hcp [Limnobacter sp.]|nr:type VI secretion system tube protein Hcp [Limnobacter sp.]